MHISYNAFLEALDGDVDKARASYNEIAVLVGGDPVSGDAIHEGGISLSGVFDDDNPSFSKEEKARIKKLIAPLSADMADEPKKESTKKEGNAQ